MFYQIKKVVFLLICLSFGHAAPINSQQVIPKPQSRTINSGHFTLNTQTQIYTNLRGKEKAMFEQYLQTLPFSFIKGKAGDIKNTIRLIIAPLTDSNQEAYSLQVSTDCIKIQANTDIGLFYGLQTLLQLTADSQSNHLHIPCTTITDTPRFGYRGFMLDVSRHFFPKEFILKLLDILAYYKINIFHFHLTDTGGWRIEIKKYPFLTQMTAFRPVENLVQWWGMNSVFCTQDTPDAYGGFYTQEEIREIVQYATVRHITVIPEIDMPGHSRAILCAYPELACDSLTYLNSNELCIGKEETFTFCENILKEVIALFPGKYIHVGGDEANRDIWEKCSLCQKRMHDNHLGTLSGLQNYFANRIEQFLHKHGKTLIGWDEILDGDISKRAVVMSWREETDGGKEALRRGHATIMSPTSHCYLDYYQDNPFFEPRGIMGYTPLEQIYKYDPVPAEEYDPALLLGVQANLWTEYIASIEHAEYMIFPRILALAEVGWTYPELKSYPEFKERVLSASDYLKNQKGIRSFNIRTEMGPRPESLIPVKSLAKGKKVTYLSPYQEFVGSKEATLTDGWLGNWNANGNRWQGFGGNMDVVIDLERITDIQAVIASFLFVPTAGEYLPDNVEVSFSDDGKNYRPAYAQEIQSDYTIKYHIYPYGWTGQDKTRYIRFHATKPITWGNILCDEIIVK